MMERWISAFLEARAAELDAAANTLAAYGRDLADFSRWLERRGLDFASLQRGDIEAYLMHCTQTGLAPSTRARRLSAIKGLFRFAFEEGWRGDNPAIRIKGGGRPKTLPGTLSREDVEALLEAARNSGRSAQEKARNGCMMELLYATGMRVSELVSLPVAAARGDPEMLLVRGKGGRERLVPLSPPPARPSGPGWPSVTARRKPPAHAAIRPRASFSPRTARPATSPATASTPS